MAGVEPDLTDEAHRLLRLIADRGIAARLFGGMGIRILAGDRLAPAFERPIQDLDFAVSKGDRNALADLLEESGYEGDQHFNALNGARRLLFVDPSHDRQVDVFVGTFEMCHALPLTERLAVLPDTLPAADVLMTKLQIVELNSKDRNDILALVLSHEIGSDDVGSINASRITELTSEDWGLQRTFEINLDRVSAAVSEVDVSSEEKQLLVGRLETLRQAIDDAPKSRRWKLRAKIGERKQWYAEPEEVDR